MFQKHWDVLIVDDEPDVLAISKLAMKSFEVFFLPIKIHTATCKKDAVELLKSKFLSKNNYTSLLSVALVDVVMENDTAGLELCQYIREEMNNYVTQLFIRTGQPGIAPERKVIDDYEISGYVSKVDATEDKLYTLIKSGIRQYYWSTISNWLSSSMSALIQASGNRYDVLNCIHDTVTILHSDHSGKPLNSVDLQLALSIDGTLVDFNIDKAEYYTEREKLNEIDPLTLSEDGDVLITDYQNLMFRIAPQPNRCSVECFARGTFSVPSYLVTSIHVWLKCLGNVWKQSR